jgi:1,2-phenylacetyl-CoA epoxidase catalytic subunit
LYETADEIRLDALMASDDPEIAGIARKMDREEAYHRMHAQMWVHRLLSSDEGKTRLNEAVDELWPYALGVLDDELRPELRTRVEDQLGRSLPDVEPVPRGVHEAELAELWEEMTSVRRSAPEGAQW